MYKTKSILIAVLIILIVVGVGIYFLPSYLAGQISQFTTQPPPNVEAYLRISGTWLTALTAVMAALMSLVNVLIQVSMSRNIESLKPLLSMQYTAYKDLNGSAIAMFDALSRLQNNAYDSDLAQLADQEMTKASGTIFFVPNDYREAWLNFQYWARLAKENANELMTSLAAGKTSYTLRIRPEDNILREIGVGEQKALWLELQPSVFSALETLANKTPHF
jgi:hypothetical protein